MSADKTRTHYEAMAREAAAPADGGSAFPGEKSMRFGQTNDCNEGMSLRDYFAAKAMMGDWAAVNGDGDLLADARRYYRMADAMLVARTEGAA